MIALWVGGAVMRDSTPNHTLPLPTTLISLVHMLMTGAHSNTLESFWSPQMSISAMDRNVSTIVCLL